MDLNYLTIDAARSAIQERETTAVSLTGAFYSKIENDDPQIGAYLTLCRERALAQAERMDRMAEEGKPLPPLGGVPVGIKDVMVTQGVRTTAGSKMLGNYIPPYDCTAVARLESAGAVILGKLNCDEFAMGSSNENSAWYPVHNPRDVSRVPGGSSGGSAAAVAADMAVATLGSDTGGSIRQPASFCGVVGFMPTYGRVSRYGLIAFASSLDHIGPLTKSVKDAALMLHVIAGRDPMDPTSADVPVPDYVAELEKPVKGLRLGVAKEYFGEGLDEEVRKSVEAPSISWPASAARSSKSRCRTLSTRFPLTTSWRRPRPRRTWRASMGFATECVPTMPAHSQKCIDARAITDSAPR